MKPWMTSEIKCLRAVWHTCRDAEAAERVGRSLQACKNMAERLKRTDREFAEAMAERFSAYREMVRDYGSAKASEMHRKRKADSEKLSGHCKP